MCSRQASRTYANLKEYLTKFLKKVYIEVYNVISAGGLIGEYFGRCVAQDRQLALRRPFLRDYFLNMERDLLTLWNHPIVEFAPG